MIVKIPNTVLTAPSKEVVSIDKKIIDVIEEMKRTLVNTRNPRGVGLAAPQIGTGLRIFITRPTGTSPIDVFINPEITWKSQVLEEIKRIDNDKNKKSHEKKLEGCLSIPNVWGYLKRPGKVKLRYMDINGKYMEKEFSDFMATIVQHETDHLNGILFTRRVLEQNQKLFKIERTESDEEKLIEIEI